MNPKVSVVIPTKNRVDLLRRALQSVVTQDYPNIEVLVVDDCSTENISELVGEFAGSGIPISVIRNHKSEGAQKSRLAGCRLGTGEVAALLDSDDWWETSKLSLQIATYRAHPTALIACRSRLLTSGRIVPRSVIGPQERVEEFLYTSATGFLQSSTFLMERKADNNIGVHDDTAVALYHQAKGLPIIQMVETLSNFDDLPRKDRRSYDLEYVNNAIRWLHRNSVRWPKRATEGYMVKDIARRYLNLGMRGQALLCVLKHLNLHVSPELYFRTSLAILFGGSPLRWLRATNAKNLQTPV
jgi:glycosyltransferase involved in cell wall biosynthesis